MGFEIERKWLVKQVPVYLLECVPYQIIQGYVSSNENETLRIRKVGEPSGDIKCYLTVKSGKGLKRREDEIEITEITFDTLWPLTEGKQIFKYRYKVNEFEIDIFEMKCFPLVLVEVEFNDEEEANNFKTPDWFGEEVTFDPKYTNAYLSINGWKENV